MTLFGIKSILIMLAIEITACFLLKQMIGLLQLIVIFSIIDALFWSILSVHNGKIRVYSFLSLFKRNILELSEIEKITIRDGGMMQSFTTIVFDLKNKDRRTIYILLYLFERKKVSNFLYNNGVEVHSFDASSNN